MDANACRQVPSAPAPASLAKFYAIGLYVFTGLWGAAQVYMHQTGRSEVAFGLVLATFATLWARYDAIARGKPLLAVTQMLYFLCWPVGAAIYLISRSGRRGLWQAAKHGLGLGAVYLLALYGTLYTLHFAGLLGPHYYE